MSFSSCRVDRLIAPFRYRLEAFPKARY